MKEFHVKEQLYIFFYSMKEISAFCKSVKLGRFMNKIYFKLVCNTSHYSINSGS